MQAPGLSPWSGLKGRTFRRDFDHRDWITKVETEAGRSKEVFVRHFQTTYFGFPTLPIWVALEVIPFGALSRLYEGMLPEDQKAVAVDYDVHPKVLRSWLRTLAYVRNLCAHHSRLWNRELSVAPDLPRHDPLWQPPITPTNRRLFAVLLILRQLMAHHHQGCHWQRNVTGLILPIAGDLRWCSAMGLPEVWERHPLWDKAGGA